MLGLLHYVVAGLLPSIEPRYAVPVCIAAGYQPAACIAVGLVDVAVLALALPRLISVVDRVLPRTRLAGLYARYRARVERVARRHEGLTLAGLIGFIAVPLPGTGMWTGALLAYILGLGEKASTLALLLGGLAGLAATLTPTLLVGGVLQRAGGLPPAS